MPGMCRRYRLCVVNGVFVSGGVGDDGRVRPPASVHGARGAHRRGDGLARVGALAVPGQARLRRPRLRDDHAASDRRVRAVSRRAIRADLAAAPLGRANRSPSSPTAAACRLSRRRRPCSGPRCRSMPSFSSAPRCCRARCRAIGRRDASVGCVLGERDWIQGVYPRLPRPWHGALRDRNRARIVAALPAHTVYRTIPCDHWPGYFTPEGMPLLVSAVCDLLQPAAVPG